MIAITKMSSHPGRLPPLHRILIRSTNWIGDAVMSVAALRELRRLCPKSHLTLLARDWVAGLFREQGLVDELMEFPGQLGSWRRLKWITSHLPKFDLALLFPNALGPALEVFSARIPERWGFRGDGRSPLLTKGFRPRAVELGHHQVFHYLDLLYRCGLSELDYLADEGFQPDVRLRAPRLGKEKASLLLIAKGAKQGHPLVAIHAGATFGPAKCWFKERFAQVADNLIACRDVQVALIGSAEERTTARQLAAEMVHDPINLAGDTDLSTLMGVLSQSALLLTNDSGPMHLAAALGLPQVALFGSTDDRATAPFDRSAHVIHKHVACSPCLLRECPIDLRCFDAIGVDEVTDRALQLLANSGRGYSFEP